MKNRWETTIDHAKHNAKDKQIEALHDTLKIFSSVIDDCMSYINYIGCLSDFAFWIDAQEQQEQQQANKGQCK